MRFDLEISIVSKLTKNGLSKAADVLYSENSTSLRHKSWDTSPIHPSETTNIGSINLDKFLNFKKIASSNFSSAVYEEAGLYINSIINNNSILCPTFIGGKYYSHKDLFNWSNTSVYDKVDYDNTEKYYKYPYIEDIDIESIDIYTLSFKYPGYTTKSKIFKYVEYNDISIESTFKSSKENYKFTILNNFIYLNVKRIEYNKVIIGRSSSCLIYALHEYPISNASLMSISSSKYKINNGILVFNNSSSLPPVNTDLKITGYITPIINYKLKSREDREDIVFKNINLNINSIGTNSGAVCLFNSYGNTEYPIELNLEKGKESEYTTEVIASLYGVNGLPIKNKKIDFTILTNDTIFADSNKSTHSSLTKLDGKTSATIVKEAGSAGYYVQTTWVSDNKITLPFKLTSKKEDIFIYYILKDDPILGTSFSGGDEFSVRRNEYYNAKDLNTYYVNGKKVAYITMYNKEDKLYTKFIKPLSVEHDIEGSIKFKNLYIKNTGRTASSEIPTSSISAEDTIVITDTNEYEENSLPISNKIEVYSTPLEESTTITFLDSIPTENVAGYWIATNSIIKVQAKHLDTSINKYLYSNILDVEVKNVKSENPFLLAGTKIPNQITEIGDYGYFSVSDYINNPYGLVPCMYCCIYSDPIEKKCIHPDFNYHKHFDLREGTYVCRHTPEIDQTLVESERCGGVKARIINPFLLNIETFEE